MQHKLLAILFTLVIAGFGVYSLTKIPIGAVPDITNNQVQVITTSENLSTEDVEKFITYPVELEMANIPGVKEIRSVSKFGLSVVTIVFEESIGTYLPRQLIAEKIKSASQNIPESFGAPEMGPITTGLGEIYQYTLDVKPAYKDWYSAADLRTIQDWIVKRELSGIKGVVEVNTWGGYLKQYEVAINPEHLNALSLTPSQVFKALEENNSIAGGSYIEKNNQAYFIRGEGLVSSKEDIENIVVSTQNHIPVLIKNVAQVKFGHATRFGAITANGEGEKVMGQIMMLKGANSLETIGLVKDRIATLQKTLPEGVYINPILDRSELIAKTTHTIAENLILGCLIVIFVVVLLLGNWRSGLVVASVIPLCLLFALSMMYIFNVNANLMSLGAIDFGIIIDGAVIIVEFIAHEFMKHSKELQEFSKSDKKNTRDTIALDGASKMMKSAFFGQIIILIVFIPILSLQGVEGKMFIPMALVFSFALIGAMILCLTYVPVASSLFLSSKKRTKPNLSDKLMAFLHKKYTPTIKFALKHTKPIIAISLLFIILGGFLFSRMGSEFVPTLDEGDFVIQPVLKTGTSLDETIKITTQIEKTLKENFPEVDQIASRIGAAEVPTDPMSMEESDVIIKLKPKDEWVSAETKDELAGKFKEALEVIPNMEIEFTQPIEMRFNELVTGVRSDIAIKIFGEDLDILAAKGKAIKNVISNIPGAADITVEKIEGLPQMRVRYNRAKIAQYGVAIADLNNLISTGFAGAKAGTVFEGEKRFDLVVRLQENYRKDIENLKRLYINTASGNKVPLEELAEISYTKGPAKISRDDTKRRIVVGVNVRNRDLQSVVDDIKKVVNSKISLPSGYNITYGGQFENLQSARNRLLIAVPVALILIFLLLYMAFNSLKEALMVFSAIPLASIGGIFFLWLRGMPFSISAGVGFIALFGIAVLNGIVLIEYFKELEHTTNLSLQQIIIKGTNDRLRPVLLTASAAALGFLPMAISTNAGAEVQRPLATVVVGGLITATLLTLIVLPVLYIVFSKPIRMKINSNKHINTLLLLITISIFPCLTNAQENILSTEAIIDSAMTKNLSLRELKEQTNAAQAQQGTAFDFGKTYIFHSYDENNLAINNEPLKVWGATQDFAFPTVYGSKHKVLKQNFEVAKAEQNYKKIQVKKAVLQSINHVQFTTEKTEIYKYLDSLYQNFSHAATRRFELGETNYLEKITAQTKQKEIAIQFQSSQQDVSSAYQELYQLSQIEKSFKLEKSTYDKILVNAIDTSNNAGLQVQRKQATLSNLNYKFEKQQLLPDISVEYFQGTNSDLNKSLSGYQIGLHIPILFNGQKARIKAAKFKRDAASYQVKSYSSQLQTKYQMLLSELQKQQLELDYYEQEGAVLSNKIIETAEKSFKNGEIDFFQYIQSIDTAMKTRLAHLQALFSYNEIAIQINHLTL
ncbi:cobalt-zinc-cadmium resistance protein CzcA [Pustulibacterium marinum]|uniref:Cobalt-zinc-cadmium resistance protein CzcA n=2 Tax=Pustulibacterium marinum TaxID=1224947 RepID=A0A1I7FTQ6_9FLAO|nr:cobalt-zinc-cadmium resistance protein CzcA [Pustulibacterium marinum]